MPDDYPATTQTSRTVEVGGSAWGEIEAAGDRDWFAVVLEAGGTYRIDLQGSETGAGTLRDPYLRGVHDAHGNRIDYTTDDDGGSGYNSRLYFTAREAGTYYVAAGAYGSRQGTYTLSVADMADGVPDDFAAGIGTTGAVAVDGSATGEIEAADDRDWFAVTLEAGRTYRIDLEGLWTGAGALYDPYLYGVHDANGDLISGTRDNNGGVTYNSRVTFTAAADGTHYVAAGANRSREGTYTLSVVRLVDGVPDDFEAGRGTTGEVAVGGSATGEIEVGGDRDWFAVTLGAGRTYRIDLEGSQTGAGTLSDPYLRGVHDADGDLISGTRNNNGGAGPNSRVTFTAAADGTYYVAASAQGAGEGTYKLSVAEYQDDFAAGTGTTGEVGVGGSATGEIEVGGDRDWFAVTLGAGRTYRIDLEGLWTRGGTLSNPYLYGVHDANGDLISGTRNNNGGAGPNSRVTFTAAQAGTYYVAAGADRTGEGTYTLSVTDLTDTFTDDFEAGTGTTGEVAVDGSATGEIEGGGDRDWFAVTLEADRTYRIDLEGLWTGAGTLSDPYLRGVHDADGNYLSGTTNDDSGEGNNSRVYFTATQAGTYYVAAGADIEWEGTYTLSVTELTDDYAAGTGTSGAVAVGGSATGEIEVGGDRDWFAVTFDAGGTYRIALEGLQTGAGTLSDPYLRGVHDADGNYLSGTTNDNDAGNYNSLVTFTAPQAGTYYVAAGADRTLVGTYTLSVVELTDDFAAGTGTSGAVAVGGSATGEIEVGGDRDWFAVTLEAGGTYRIDLEGSRTGGGTLRDPYLRGVHDANGDFISGTTNDDSDVGSYNSLVTFTAAQAGTYYVAAGADRTGEGTYTLSVTDLTVVDDFAAGTGTTGMVAVDGSATGEIEGGGDRDWFAVTLEADRTYRIDLEGLWTGAGTLSDPYLRGVHDADGNLIAYTTDDDGGLGNNSRVTFTAAQAGTYYVAASADRTLVGTYTLSVADVTDGVPDDFEAGRGTTGEVAVGGSARGEIDFNGDRDWFAVTLEAGGTYRIDLEGRDAGGGGLRNPYLHGVYDADGDLIGGTTDDDGGYLYNSRVTFTAAGTGTYYVAAGADRPGEGTYTLWVVGLLDGVLDDFEAGRGTTGEVAVGGSARGEIDFDGDRDWFAVTLETGGTYRIDLEGSRTGGGTLMDPYLRGVHDANGDRIARTRDDDGGEGRNSQLTFTAAQAGTYYVAAGAYQDEEGSYTLSVTEVPDDFGPGRGTTGEVAVDGSARGEIEVSGDRDWFAVTLEAGRTYRIDLKGVWTRDGTLYDPYLRGIHDAAGDLIDGTTDDSGGVGRNSRVTFTAVEAGTYYVAAGADGDREGTYTLSVVDVTDGVPDDFATGAGTTGAVAVGGSVTGEIDFNGDHDWFAVEFEAGSTYRIDLEGAWTGRGTLYDPYLRGVHNAAGVLLADTTDDDGGWGRNSRVTFTAEETGTYYVAASGDETREGTYTLSVEEVL